MSPLSNKSDKYISRVLLVVLVAFKDRWFPKFLKKRFPVNWDEFKLYNICPHINHTWPENRNMHILWIEKNHGFSPHAEVEE